MNKVSKESVNYRPADSSRHCGNCVMIRLNAPDFESHSCTLVKGLIEPEDVCDRWEAELSKSERTPALSSTHNPLGTRGLWHTPDSHTTERQSLPAYLQNIAHALIRNGMDESQAIATAINAAKRWASGKGNVHPEVVEASRAALAEWEKLKASHH